MSPQIAEFKRFTEVPVVVLLLVFSLTKHQNNDNQHSLPYSGHSGMPLQNDSAQRKYRVLLCLQYCRTVEMPPLWLQKDTDSFNQSGSQDSCPPYRFKKTVICVQVRRIGCQDCGCCARERLDFCPGTNVTYTKWLAKFVLALRAQMSISAVAELTGLH